MEHTQGEWQTVFFKGMDEQEMYVKVSGGVCICKILDRPKVEKEANARLIAAAPDLLAALKEIKASEARCKKRGIGYDEHIHNIAKAAITKATQ